MITKTTKHGIRQIRLLAAWLMLMAGSTVLGMFSVAQGAPTVTPTLPPFPAIALNAGLLVPNAPVVLSLDTTTPTAQFVLLARQGELIMIKATRASGSGILNLNLLTATGTILLQASPQDLAGRLTNVTFSATTDGWYVLNAVLDLQNGGASGVFKLTLENTTTQSDNLFPFGLPPTGTGIIRLNSLITMTPSPILTTTRTPSQTFTATQTLTPTRTLLPSLTPSETWTFTPSPTVKPRLTAIRSVAPSLLLYAAQPPDSISSSLYLLNVDTGEKQIIATIDKGTIFYSALSPNGQEAIFESCYNKQCNIFRVKVNGGKPIQLTQTGLNRLPRWSPDGTLIIFASNRNGGDYEIYTMRPDGSNVHQLTHGPPRSYAASFSPDGAYIVMQRNPNNIDQISVMNLQTQQVNQLTSEAVAQVGASWSPDGKRIAFYSLPADTSQIYIINKDGSGRQQLTSSNQASFMPAWNASSTEIVFQRSVNGKQSLLKIDVTTRVETILLSDNNINHNATWWIPMNP